MIRALSETLRRILEQSKSKFPDPLNSALIDFKRPVEGYQPSTLPTINLFLYDVRENVELRSNGFTVAHRNGNAELNPPPMRIDCSYLVTAWTDENTEDGILNEHRLLSQVLQVFSRFSTIPESFIPANSLLKQQDYALPIITARADTLNNLSEFWTALGNQLRASLSLVITLSVPIADQFTAPLVTTLSSEFGVDGNALKETLISIGGRVFDTNRNGISSALIEILDQDAQSIVRQTVSNSQGYFLFAQISSGTFPVRVTAIGFEPKFQTLTVAGRSQDYDIQLTSL